MHRPQYHALLLTSLSLSHTHTPLPLFVLVSPQELIDARTSTPAAMQLQQRCWLMHWGLFLLGSATSGRSVVCDLFLQDKYLQAVQTNAPHLLRYLAVAVVTNPRRKDKMRELVRALA